MSDTNSPSRLIETGSRIRMHFALALADGTEAVSTFEEEPLELTLGDGTLLATLEENLIGLAAGARQTFLLGSDHAYGPRDESLAHNMPLSDFPQRPEVGQIIGFALANGEETAGAVLSVDDERVRVDFNHPLAGRDLVFRVAILEVRPPEGSPA